MTKNSKIQKQDSFFKRTRPLQIALLVIAVAFTSFAVFSSGFLNNGSNQQKKTAAPAHAEGDSKVVKLTDAAFDETISNGIALVDFWAVWCPPCRIQSPIIEQVAAEIGNEAIIAKLDVDHNPRSTSKHRVQNIPTLIIFKDGRPVQRFVGVQQKETLLAAIRSHI